MFLDHHFSNEVLGNKFNLFWLFVFFLWTLTLYGIEHEIWSQDIFVAYMLHKKFWPRFYCHIPLGFDLGFRMTKIRFSIFTSFRRVAFRPKNIKTFFACGKFSAVISNLIFIFFYNIKSNATRIHQNTDLFY